MRFLFALSFVVSSLAQAACEIELTARAINNVPNVEYSVEDRLGKEVKRGVTGANGRDIFSIEDCSLLTVRVNKSGLHPNSQFRILQLNDGETAQLLFHFERQVYYGK